MDHAALTDDDPPAPRTPWYRTRRKAAAKGVAFALVFGLAMYLLSLLPITDELKTFTAWVDGPAVGQLRGSAVLAAVYMLITLSPFPLPGTVLNVGAGFLFGVVFGSLATLVGCMGGATCSFFLARGLCMDATRKRADADGLWSGIANAMRDANGDGRKAFKVVVMARVPPVFPFALFNYAFALTDVSFKTYFVATAVGVYPAVVLDCYIGSICKSLAEATAGGGSALSENQEIALLVFYGVTGIAASVYLGWRIRAIFAGYDSEEIPAHDEFHGDRTRAMT